MGTLTLEELRAKNESEEVLDDFVEESEEEESEGESSKDEEIEEESEAWKQTEDKDSEDGEKLFTGSDIAAAKRKLKGKIEKKDSEIDELRQENERLRQNAPQGASEKPKRDDFLDADDPDEAFTEALMDWRFKDQSQQTQQRESLQAEKQAVSESVARHYDSAAKLVKEHGISADVYRDADAKVRQAVEHVLPKQGEIVTDALIAKLGEGSEKAFYYLGRNKAKLTEFQNALLTDPSGLSAAMLLGEIKQSVLMPGKRASRAPEPATQIQGDETKTMTAEAKQLLKKYREAHKKADHQSSYNVKKEARAKGIDVSNW